MKQNISHLLMLGLTVLAGLCVTTSVPAQEIQSKELILTARVDRESYLPGEGVRLTVSLANRSGETIRVVQPDVANGSLRLFAAFREEPFRLYTGPDANSRGELSQPVGALKAGETFSVETTILYHRVRPTSHLTELYARPIRESELGDSFALNRPGQYHVKAVFRDAVSKTNIESGPIEINVREPLGWDAFFWNGIKDSDAAAYLLHTGRLMKRPDTAEGQRFVEKMEELLTHYRESSYAANLDFQQAKQAAARNLIDEPKL